MREREGTIEDYIGFVDLLSGESRCSIVPETLDEIKNWAEEKELDVVIWTDLPSKFDDRNKKKMVYKKT